eukprot:g2950.t1
MDARRFIAGAAAMGPQRASPLVRNVPSDVPSAATRWKKSKSPRQSLQSRIQQEESTAELLAMVRLHVADDMDFVHMSTVLVKLAKAQSKGRELSVNNKSQGSSSATSGEEKTEAVALIVRELARRFRSRHVPALEGNASPTERRQVVDPKAEDPRCICNTVFALGSLKPHLSVVETADCDPLRRGITITPGELKSDLRALLESFHNVLERGLRRPKAEAPHDQRDDMTAAPFVPSSAPRIQYSALDFKTLTHGEKQRARTQKADGSVLLSEIGMAQLLNGYAGLAGFALPPVAIVGEIESRIPAFASRATVTVLASLAKLYAATGSEEFRGATNRLFAQLVDEKSALSGLVDVSRRRLLPQELSLVCWSVATVLGAEEPEDRAAGTQITAKKFFDNLGSGETSAMLPSSFSPESLSQLCVAHARVGISSPWFETVVVNEAIRRLLGIPAFSDQELGAIGWSCGKLQLREQTRAWVAGVSHHSFASLGARAFASLVWAYAVVNVPAAASSPRQLKPMDPIPVDAPFIKVNKKTTAASTTSHASLIALVKGRLNDPAVCREVRRNEAVLSQVLYGLARVATESDFGDLLLARTGPQDAGAERGEPSTSTSSAAFSPITLGKDTDWVELCGEAVKSSLLYRELNSENRAGTSWGPSPRGTPWEEMQHTQHLANAAWALAVLGDADSALLRLYAATVRRLGEQMKEMKSVDPRHLSAFWYVGKRASTVSEPFLDALVEETKRMFESLPAPGSREHSFSEGKRAMLLVFALQTCARLPHFATRRWTDFVLPLVAEIGKTGKNFEFSRKTDWALQNHDCQHLRPGDLGGPIAMALATLAAVGPAGRFEEDLWSANDGAGNKLWRRIFEESSVTRKGESLGRISNQEEQFAEHQAARARLALDVLLRESDREMRSTASATAAPAGAGGNASTGVLFPGSGSGSSRSDERDSVDSSRGHEKLSRWLRELLPAGHYVRVVGGLGATSAGKDKEVREAAEVEVLTGDAVLKRKLAEAVGYQYIDVDARKLTTMEAFGELLRKTNDTNESA